MATDKVGLQMRAAQGRFMGFANLFRKESNEWWRTRKWLVHAIIWLLLINGIVFAVTQAPSDPKVPPEQQPSGAMIFVIMGGLMTGLGIIIVMQGSILDEKKSGTAAWVLSKPLSRTAFITAKLLANAVAALLVMVILQGVIAFLILSTMDKNPPALMPFVLGLVLIMLHLLFYLTLTLMLGTLFNERGPILGIPIGLLFGAQILASLSPALAQIMPWPIVMPIGPESPDALAVLAIQGQPITNLLPIVATVIWIVIFIGVSLWRFDREEF